MNWLNLLCRTIDALCIICIYIHHVVARQKKRNSSRVEPIKTIGRQVEYDLSCSMQKKQQQQSVWAVASRPRPWAYPARRLGGWMVRLALLLSAGAPRRKTIPPLHPPCATATEIRPSPTSVGWARALGFWFWKVFLFQTFSIYFAERLMLFVLYVYTYTA